MIAMRTADRRRRLRSHAAAALCLWALSFPLAALPASARASGSDANAVRGSGGSRDSTRQAASARRALRVTEGTSTHAHAAAPPPPGHAGLTAALPPSVRRSVIDGVSAESVDTAGIEAASAALSVQVRAAHSSPAGCGLRTRYASYLCEMLPTSHLCRVFSCATRGLRVVEPCRGRAMQGTACADLKHATSPCRGLYVHRGN